MTWFLVDFLQAYKLKMYGARYLWILAAKYSDNWWESTDAEYDECSESQLKQALEGFISTDILLLSASNEITISGQVGNAQTKTIIVMVSV